MYSLYSLTTGIIVGQTNDRRTGQGYGIISGNYPTGYYVKGGVKPLPPRPGPLVYQWDLATESWLIDLPASIDQQRKRRDQLLSAVDRVNPMWYASLSPERQTELQQYRLALLAVPQQPGFPESIEWPAKPAWL